MAAHTLNVVTYNIQFGINNEKIIVNVERLANEGADIICLQETINVVSQEMIVHTIIKKLGKNWQAAWHIGPEISRHSIGTCILWNMSELHQRDHWTNLAISRSLLLQVPASCLVDKAQPSYASYSPIR